AVRDYDTNTKIKPPLRSERDRDAVRQGLKDGTIDAIATDHAPHTIVDKECEYKFATFGTIGFETAFPVIYTHLVEPGIITLNNAVKAMTCTPASVLGINRGTLKVGAQANIMAFDPNLEMTYEQSHIVSKSKNSVFLGQKLKGFPVLTLCCGKVIMSDRKMV
ncbi:MAG TPA: amidohydrolase family protein, partial [bacterium]|nr:amidohydrolase family protein [bacterium]